MLLWDLNEQDGSDLASMSADKQAVFHCNVLQVSKQILKVSSEFYWQPVKGTQQWNTVSKWW